MRKSYKNNKTAIIIDFIIIVLCALGVNNISNKAGLPFKLQHENSKLKIIAAETLHYSLKDGDVITSLDNVKIETIEEAEILLDGKNIGESISLGIQSTKQRSVVEVRTIKYYSTFYLLVATIVGLMFILVAILVFLKCDIKETALILHWALMFTAMIILMTWGNYSKPTYFLGFVTRVGFHMGYIFAPVFFLFFIAIFPKRIAFNIKRLSQLIVMISISLFIALNYTFFLYLKNKDLVQMRIYVNLFDISSIFIILIALSAIILFLHTYITSNAEIERKKIRWILLGFILGPINYVLFWVIPSRLWNNPVIPEPLVLLLVSFVPITFGIAIIKYRILDIDIIFKRGLVYSVVISFLLIIYLGIIALLAKLLNNPESEVSSIIAAISIALLFQPAKARVQKIVNKKFFRVEYDYRIALNLFVDEIKDVYNANKLTPKVIELINTLIPVNKIGFFLFNQGTTQIEVSAHKNYDHIIDKKINLNINNPIFTSSIPLSGPNNVEVGVNVTKSLPQEFIDLGADLVFIIPSSNNATHGFLILGEKKSETKFTAEDIDLLNIISARLALTFDRIKLQEEIIREHIETERLEELNKLKSYFVSSVSHDLKTPLTSIKMFAEKLKAYPELSQDKVNNYLNIIEGESNRLTRLIDNVLDYSKIEAGVKKYTFSQTNLVLVIQNVLNSMEYQFTMNNFEIRTVFLQNKIFLSADTDAIAEAIINIFSNSIKYHSEKKIIEIRVRQNTNQAIIEIQDWGKGIAEEELKYIFMPFFRSQQQKFDKSKGSGLGLAIVKHILDAHNGTIEVESKLGQGTTIKLIFPIRNYNEKNITN